MQAAGLNRLFVLHRTLVFAIYLGGIVGRCVHAYGMLLLSLLQCLATASLFDASRGSKTCASLTFVASLTAACFFGAGYGGNRSLLLRA